MSRSHRSDAPLLPGFHHSGDRGLGVRGADVAQTGTHGPGIIFPSISLPAENNDEFRLVVVTRPAGLPGIQFDEDGAAVPITAPDGTYVGSFRLYKNGVDVGVAAYQVTWGTPSLSGTALLDDAIAVGNLGQGPASALGGNAALGDAVASGDLASAPPAPSTLGGTAALGDAVASGDLASAPPAPSALGGAAALGDVDAAGGLASIAPPPAPTLQGSAQLDSVGAAGVVVGGGAPPAGPLVVGKRVVVSTGRKTPVRLLSLDVAEIDDVIFRFGKDLLEGETVVGASVTSIARSGVDLAASPLLAGTLLNYGADQVARVRGALGVAGVTYLLRCEATLSSGRVLLSSAFIKCERRA